MRILLAFFALAGLLGASVINKDAILSPEVSAKIAQISSELKEKTGVNTLVIATNDLGKTSPNELVSSLNLAPPYAVLLLSKAVRAKDGSIHPLVDIIASDEALKLFDKAQILSPFPERGTILPILTSNKGKDIYNAALLNGYADLAEQIASSKGVKLQSGIGSANKHTLNFLRYLIYGFLVVAVVIAIKKGRNRETRS